MDSNGFLLVIYIVQFSSSVNLGSLFCNQQSCHT